MRDEIDFIAGERQRVQAEYRRREKEVSGDLYAPWNPSAILEHTERKRMAAMMLRQAGAFPEADAHCLEVGYGSLGWLGDLITWGVRQGNLHGIELDPVRARRAQEILPMADLRVGDATSLPWDSNMFRLAVVSTVFTSILDPKVRRRLADEVTRVLAPGGALLWYDFAVNNPRNPRVRRVDRKELRRLFLQLRGEIKSVTLAPPLARFIAPKSWVLATLLTAIPILRTHLLAVLIKTP